MHYLGPAVVKDYQTLLTPNTNSISDTVLVMALAMLACDFGLKEMADGGIRCKSMNTRPYLSLRVRIRISRHEE